MKSILELPLAPFSPIQLDGYLNVLFAPGGDLDKSGLRLQVGGQGGTFIQGPTEAQANFLLGYSFASGDNSLTLMSGVGVQSTHFTGHRVRNVNLEWASSAELDTKPTQSTTLTAQASYSTALNEYYSQLDAGYAVAKDLYLGPFVAFVGDDRFQQGRVGAKFFGIKFGSAELGLNAGYLEDLGKPSDRDHDSVVNGAFVGADVSVRY